MQLSGSRAVAVAVVAVCLATAGGARADGEVSARTMYYKEKATRVAQPMIDFLFDASDRGVVEGHVLVDAITSASAGGFDENRVEGGLGYTHQQGDLKLGGQARYSTEPDYRSVTGGLQAQLELLDKNVTVSLGLGLGRDHSTNAGAGAMAPRVEGDLTTMMTTLGVSQVLGPNAVASLTYDFLRVDGVQHNLYRQVSTADGGLVFEHHPDLRLRHAFAGSLRWFLPAFTTTVVAQYRFYTDDWALHAHTPELRLTKDVGDWLALGLRYRYHRQDAAFFYRERYPTAQELISLDAKLSAFDSHLVGGRLEVAGGALGLGGRLEAARAELVGEYVIQHNAFGNAMVAYAALVLPLEY